LNHGLRLIRRHYFVFESLKEDHGTRQLFGEVDRRARYINVTLFGIRSHESIEIPRLKFMRFFCQRFSIADAVVAGSGAERVTESQRTKRRVAPRAAAGNHKAIAIDFTLLNQITRAVCTVVDINYSPL